MSFIIAFLLIFFSILFLRKNKKTDILDESGKTLPSTGSIYSYISLTIGIIILLLNFIVSIPAGNVGIVDIFGKVKDDTLKPGLNIVEPWAKVVRMSVKTQEMKEIAEVPSKEGLIVNLEFSVLYHLDPNKANEIYKTVGPNYEEIILIPQLRSVIRDVTASYEAKSLYTEERQKLAEDVYKSINELVNPRGIIIEKTPLRKVILPSKLTAAIEEKLKAEQESLRMQFILEKEKKEAERKAVEAEGIKKSNNIISESLTQEYLQWYYIQSLQQLIDSPNNTVIIAPFDQKLTPLLQIPTNK